MVHAQFHNEGDAAGIGHPDSTRVGVAGVRDRGPGTSDAAAAPTGPRPIVTGDRDSLPTVDYPGFLP